MTRALCEGPPPPTVDHPEHPDLVVVPGARADPLRRLLSDHHIRRVLHHAAVPVLVVPVQP